MTYRNEIMPNEWISYNYIKTSFAKLYINASNEIRTEYVTRSEDSNEKQKKGNWYC